LCRELDHEAARLAWAPDSSSLLPAHSGLRLVGRRRPLAPTAQTRPEADTAERRHHGRPDADRFSENHDWGAICDQASPQLNTWICHVLGPIYAGQSCSDALKTIRSKKVNEEADSGLTFQHRSESLSANRVPTNDDCC
jgi:hypothetical protein